MRPRASVRAGTSGAAPAMLAVAILLGLPGCGGSDASSTPPSGAAAARAAASGTGSSGRPVDTADLVRRVDEAVRAESTATITFTSDAASGQSTGSGAVRYLDKGAEMRFDMTAAGQRLAMIVLSDALYVHSPEKVRGKNWLKISRAGTDPLSRSFSQLFDSVTANTDVSTTVAALKNAKFTDGGTAHVGGKAMHRYVADLDEKALVAELPASLRSSLGPQFKGAHGSTTLYLDDADLPLRIESSIELSSGPSTSAVSYAGWGEPVSIAAPPASQVTDLAALPR